MSRDRRFRGLTRFLSRETDRVVLDAMPKSSTTAQRVGIAVNSAETNLRGPHVDAAAHPQHRDVHRPPARYGSPRDSPSVQSRTSQDRFPNSRQVISNSRCSQLRRGIRINPRCWARGGRCQPGCILVSRQGTVKFIDCDSFQVSDGPRVFTCDVGVPHFTAPELQGKSFRGLQRADA